MKTHLYSAAFPSRQSLPNQLALNKCPTRWLSSQITTHLPVSLELPHALYLSSFLYQLTRCISTFNQSLGSFARFYLSPSFSHSCIPHTHHVFLRCLSLLQKTQHQQIRRWTPTNAPSNSPPRLQSEIPRKHHVRLLLRGRNRRPRRRNRRPHHQRRRSRSLPRQHTKPLFQSPGTNNRLRLVIYRTLTHHTRT